MITTTQFRMLRLKYNIPLSAISDKAGISNQHLSRMELGTIRRTNANERRLSQAVEALIEESRTVLDQMEQDFLGCREQLLEPVKVETEEWQDEL